MALKKKRKSVISVPSLADIETSTRFPEGVYQAKVVGCEPTEASTGTDQIAWKFEITDGKFSGKTIPHYTPLTDKSLWKLKKLLEAIGFEIPDEEFDIDPDDVIDSELSIQIGDHEYEGRTRSEVVDYASAGEEELSEEEEEEKPEPKAKGKKAAKKEPEEEEEEEEAPKSKGKKAGKKKKPAVTEEDVNNMDQEELESFVSENDIEVDLDEFKTLTKKRAAVIKAAGELIAD